MVCWCCLRLFSFCQQFRTQIQCLVFDSVLQNHVCCAFTLKRTWASTNKPTATMAPTPIFALNVWCYENKLQTTQSAVALDYKCPLLFCLRKVFITHFVQCPWWCLNAAMLWVRAPLSERFLFFAILKSYGFALLIFSVILLYFSHSFVCPAILFCCICFFTS